MTKANIIVKKNQEEVVSALCSKIESKSNEVLNNDSSGTYNIGLSGREEKLYAKRVVKQIESCNVY